MMLFTKLLRSLSISFLAAETRKKNNTRNISIPTLITLNVSTLSLPFQRHAYIQSLQMSFFLLVISQLARNFYYKKGCELFFFFVSSTQFNERAGREIDREKSFTIGSHSFPFLSLIFPFGSTHDPI